MHTDNGYEQQIRIAELLLFYSHMPNITLCFDQMITMLPEGGINTHRRAFRKVPEGTRRAQVGYITNNAYYPTCRLIYNYLPTIATIKERACKMRVDNKMLLP